MALKRLLRVKVLGRPDDADADVELTEDRELGWRALVTARCAPGKPPYKTQWFERERDAIAAVATWMYSQLDATATSLGMVVAISGAREMAAPVQLG